jgi:hypothetical protein
MALRRSKGNRANLEFCSNVLVQDEGGPRALMPDLRHHDFNIVNMVAEIQERRE